MEINIHSEAEHSETEYTFPHVYIHLIPGFKGDIPEPAESPTGSNL